MEFLKLLNSSKANKELKIENAYFHGEKIAALLTDLVRAEIMPEIMTQQNMLSNLNDLVISWANGQYVFYGQLYSRPELSCNAKEAAIIERAKIKADKIAEKAAKKAHDIEQKRLKALIKSFKGPIFDLAGDYNMLACNEGMNQAVLYNWKGYQLVELSKEPLNNEIYFFFPGNHTAQFLNQFKLNKFLSNEYLRKKS